MNEQELREFQERRGPSPHAAKFGSDLHCYGCAHSAASAPPPGAPSGERPCCSCVRNPERTKWEADREYGAMSDGRRDSIAIGDDGHARDFDPFNGSLYNGAPTVYQPMDRYVTLDQHDQERFLDEHPEYAKPVRAKADGTLEVVTD